MCAWKKTIQLHGEFIVSVNAIVAAIIIIIAVAVIIADIVRATFFIIITILLHIRFHR